MMIFFIYSSVSLISCISLLKVVPTPDFSPRICVIPRVVFNFFVSTRSVVEVMTDVMRLCLEYGVQGNEDEATNVEEAIRGFSKVFKDQKYTDLDIASLFLLIPKVTKISPNNLNVNFQQLYSSLEDIKNIRNTIGNNGTYFANRMIEISKKIERIVDQMGMCFKIEPRTLSLIKEKFRKKTCNIENPIRSREKELNTIIALSVIKENREKWAPMMMKSVEFDTLPIINIKIRRSDIFHATGFEVLSAHNTHGISDSHILKTISCADILSVENRTNVFIIEGNPGSGKSTYIRMITLEFCKNCVKDISLIFTQIESYGIMMLINCRDRENIRSFWQFFELHFPDIAHIYQENKWAVMTALRETKMIIAIDGLDEANESTATLVGDIIHHFAGSDTVRFLITTRPGYGKNVKKQFDKKTVEYRVLNIKPIENIDDQQKFISRVIKMIPSINKEEIMKTFEAKRDELSTHFHRPICLMLFIALFLRFPEKTCNLSHEVSLMQLYTEMLLKEMSERMPHGFDDRQNTLQVMKKIGQKSLWLIQNNTYEIDQNNFDTLSEECCKLNEIIQIEKVLSCVFLKRKCSQTVHSATHDFYHRSQQEYFASKVLTHKLVNTRGGTVLQILQDLTGEDVQEADLKR